MSAASDVKLTPAVLADLREMVLTNELAFPKDATALSAQLQSSQS